MTAHKSNTLNQITCRTSESFSLPSVFCWTKMGVESGQGLKSILHRKELERQSGGGLFSWGIGNSVGPALAYARQSVSRPSLSTLFTLMKSAPKSIDVAPEALVLWLGFTTETGTVSALPEHMLITSRQHGPSGAEKRAHYALMCRRSSPLRTLDESPKVDGSCVRNLVSDGRVGHSQVTSVVRYDPDLAEPNSSTYPVIFDAELAEQWFVRLANPVVISGELANLYASACSAENAAQWIRAIGRLKAAAGSTATSHKPAQHSLFQAL